MMQKGRTKVKSVFNFYHQNSDSGEQVYDNSKQEEVNVIEPMIFVNHQIDEKTSIDARIVFDLWTAASDTKLDESTGASGEGIKNQSRIGVDLGIKREIESLQYGLNLGFSSEYDYRSLNVSANIAHGFAKDNFTIGYSTQYYKDEVDLFQNLSSPSSALITKGLPRNIWANTISMSQILTAKDIAQFDFTYVQAKKNLESTASSVKVAGVRQNEILPGSRDRYGSSLKWVHGLGEASALNLSYRYYFDDWGIHANTARAAFLIELNDDEDMLEFYIRYHQQTRADYYKNEFISSERFMTSDSDINAFTSLEYGLYREYTISDKKLFGIDLEDCILGTGLVYSKRSTGMDIIYAQTSFKVEF